MKTFTQEEYIRLIAEDVVDLMRELEDKFAEGFEEPGICAQIDSLYVEYFGLAYIDLERIFKEWPESTGLRGFPVPHPLLTPSKAYRNSQKWANTEYGDSRRDLAAFIADWIEEHLEELIASSIQ